MELLDREHREHYLKSFNIFRTRSGEAMKMLESFQTHIPPLIQSQLVSECEQLNILSVGSAEGNMDMTILKIIKEELQKSDRGRHIKIFNRAVEPNEYMCGLYKVAIENLSSPLDDQQTAFEICQQTFEEYQESKKEQMKFDIVHFIHSIYHVDIEKTLLHCFEKELSKKGHVVCMVDTTQELNLPFKVFNFTKEQCNGDVANNSLHDRAETLIQIANKNGWKHEVCTIEYPIDVTEVFDPQSTEGNLLLDFLTHKVNFQGTADKQLVEGLLALIKDLSVVKEGKRIGKGIECLIVICQPNNDM